MPFENPINMTLDHLTLNITYDATNNNFKTAGNVNEEGRVELVESFLHSQLGAGKDAREANIQDTYSIQIKWYPANDRMEVSSDTGNSSLRDGILMHYLSENS